MVSRTLLLSGLLSAGVLFCCTAAQAQNPLHNDDISIGAIYETTQNASGNGITDTASQSGGVEAAFRHSYHWWFGWEGAYDYSRFTEFYTGRPFGYQHNLHAFSASYYVHGPIRILGIQPFAIGGISAMVFSPSLNGGQHAAWQARPGADFGAGINYALLSSHVGLRLQYRGFYAKAPDFGQSQLTTNAMRLTSEPMAGLYIQF